MNVINKAATL